jgi:hypothetical protein
MNAPSRIARTAMARSRAVFLLIPAARSTRRSPLLALRGKLGRRVPELMLSRDGALADLRPMDVLLFQSRLREHPHARERRAVGVKRSG